MDEKKRKELISELIAEMEKLGADASYHQVPKNNAIRDAIRIQKYVNEDFNLHIGCLYYIDDLEKELERGKSIAQVAKEVVDFHKNEAYHAGIKEFSSMLLRFSEVKDYICETVVNYALNEDRLQGMPHRRLLDLAVIYRICTPEFAVDITNTYLRLWKISTEELEAAAAAYKKRHVPQIMEVDGFNVEKIDPQMVQKDRMYAILNDMESGGDAVMMEDAFLKRIFESAGGYFVIPSSIHELIIVPLEFTEEYMHEFDQMIQEVNKGQLEDNEILSDHCYYYSEAGLIDPHEKSI